MKTKNPKTQTVSTEPPTKITTTTTPTPSTPAPDTYTVRDVARHADASSCWTIVHGAAYDVTTWITRHPGGQSAIKAMCGIDATALFDSQHGGQARVESILAGFKIGSVR